MESPYDFVNGFRQTLSPPMCLASSDSSRANRRDECLRGPVIIAGFASTNEDRMAQHVLMLSCYLMISQTSAKGRLAETVAFYSGFFVVIPHQSSTVGEVVPHYYCRPTIDRFPSEGTFHSNRNAFPALLQDNIVELLVPIPDLK